jgi:hypothetical protein
VWVKYTNKEGVAECTSKRVSKCPNAKYLDMGIAYMVIVLLIGIGASV